MSRTEHAKRIANALVQVNMSQRQLAELSGISQSTISRIIAGDRQVTAPELMLFAHAMGLTLRQLLGTDVASRIKLSARSTNGAAMETMRARLIYLAEIDLFLEDQGIPSQ
ncbi:transcriptional regulator [Corynebacterium phocae]|uniref:Transcriptional regulator n=1 Tax=Corynebacterium phocae TaxID=161895 RepID=A0A1L7D277_9CORY|nr:helix-turn-helix transcriptional regulator [Corynebacterium phocae]APT92167.1 transcriptional regulator [Corynebacterium phocae]KAA8725954.1 helix-turn-helix transcriptional regulator [Corynebacterium phocae]